MSDRIIRCDLLKNSYLCLLNNTRLSRNTFLSAVVICWKIRIFAYWTTPTAFKERFHNLLWFAEKFVSLLIEQHRGALQAPRESVVICWKIRIFAYWTTPASAREGVLFKLWFAEKFVSLLIEQHQARYKDSFSRCCDLLKNSYLCLLNNTTSTSNLFPHIVVICWKIRIFAYWTTPITDIQRSTSALWFAEKFVSLLIEQHPGLQNRPLTICCDLLKNSYLCLLNNTLIIELFFLTLVVICWKIRIFAYWTTPTEQH